MKRLVKRWRKIGGPTVHFEKYGKKCVSQIFKNPITGEKEEYVLIGQRDWSTCLAITEDKCVIAVQEHKKGADQIIFELPGGTANFEGESPEAVMKRELLEETGFMTEKVIHLGPPCFMSPGVSWSRFHTFLALGCRKKQEPKNDPKEQIAVHLIPLEEWLESYLKKLVNPSTIIASYRALSYLRL